jgi:anti-sigma regulatory factor (Ser/Thr protein kinase)
MRPMELILHSHPSATGRLRASLDAVADEYRLPPDERFELKIAATEALTNALKGTSEGDPVHIRIVPSSEAIEVEVADRGTFTPAGGADEEGGRGIPLMLALVDEVEFSSGAAGTRVRVRKRITPISRNHRLRRDFG